MWLVLEQDRTLFEQVIQTIKQAGMECEGAVRLDQLSLLPQENVSLVLRGDGFENEELPWKAPMVYLSPLFSTQMYKTARDLHCVDAVAPPISIDYLRRWEKGDIEQGITQAKPLSALDRVMQEKMKGHERRTSYHTMQNPLLDGSVNFDNLRGRIVLFYSLVGGAGRTVLTVLFAQYLAKRGFDVAVVDFNQEGKLLGKLGKIGHASIHTDEWVKMPSNMDERQVRESLMQVNGYYVLPGGRDTTNLSPPVVRRIVANIANYFDVVLVDSAPAGTITEPVTKELAHRIVYVMPAEWTSFKTSRDTFESVRLQKGTENVISVLNGVEHSREHKRLLQMIAESYIKEFATIYDDPEIKRAIRAVETVPLTKNVIRGFDTIFDALRFGKTVPKKKSKGWKLW